MAERRRYTKRQEATAVMAAAMSNVSAAAEQTGIPRTTIQRWIDEPWAVELRRKTADDLGDEMRVLALLATEELTKAVRSGKVGPRDLIPLMGVAVDKSQLLTGKPTGRTEHRDTTGSLEDHEREALADAVDEWLAKTKGSRRTAEERM